MPISLEAARRIARRLAVILLVVAALSAGSYAVAVSPLGPPTTALLRALPGAPQPPAPRAARGTTAAGAPATAETPAVAEGPAGGEASAAGSAAGAGEAPTAERGVPPGRPAGRPGAATGAAAPGGGRGPSLAHGLPELGRHIAIIAAPIVAFALG